MVVKSFCLLVLQRDHSEDESPEEYSAHEDATAEDDMDEHQAASDGALLSFVLLLPCTRPHP